MRIGDREHCQSRAAEPSQSAYLNQGQTDCRHHGGIEPEGPMHHLDLLKVWETRESPLEAGQPSACRAAYVLTATHGRSGS
ncbi:hypothetical protein B1H18_26055 [Streptomyces tsukubensis]|uniref:Uncharacterized protein n=1 Tax=Streptomyces tsukubensis TaxID=83656 RepID=A0A1V4A2Y6_9ACTN|nr:hypothetical protein B1H18_26055 [Streptomyces tsukubensis]